MYGKLYSQIFDGTLHGNLEATAVFMALIAIADSDGVVDLTLTALTSRTGWPQEFIERGIAELEQADEHSRTPDEEGRRIVRLRDNTTWGWRITNYLKYREIRDESSRRDYMRKYMRDRRSKQSVNSVSNGKPPLAKAEAEAEAEPREDPPSLRSGGPGGAEVLNGQHEQGYRENPALPHDAEAAKTGRKQGKRLASRRVPEDFAITPKLRQLEAELPADFDLDGETSKFRDHEFRVAHSDWPATWRKWMRTARDDKRYAKKREQRWE